MTNERETVNPELARQNDDLAVLRRLYERDLQDLRRLYERDLQDLRQRMMAVERTVKVRTHAHNTAHEVELHERFGRLGVPQ